VGYDWALSFALPACLVYTYPRKKAKEDRPTATSALRLKKGR